MGIVLLALTSIQVWLLNAQSGGPMNSFTWFVRESWYYLGCDQGKNRWKARAHLVVYVLPTYLKWKRLMNGILDR